MWCVKFFWVFSSATFTLYDDDYIKIYQRDSCSVWILFRIIIYLYEFKLLTLIKPNTEAIHLQSPSCQNLFRRVASQDSQKKFFFGASSLGKCRANLIWNFFREQVLHRAVVTCLHKQKKRKRRKRKKPTQTKNTRLFK